MRLHNPRYLWMFGAAAATLAVWILCLIPAPPRPPVEMSDKTEHFLAYAALMVGWGSLWPGFRRQWVVGLVLCMNGVAIEYAQRATGYRSFEVADMIANSIGVAIGLGILLTPPGAWLGRMLTRPGDRSRDTPSWAVDRVNP